MTINLTLKTNFTLETTEKYFAEPLKYLSAPSTKLLALWGPAFETVLMQMYTRHKRQLCTVVVVVACGGGAVCQSASPVAR